MGVGLLAIWAQDSLVGPGAGTLGACLGVVALVLNETSDSTGLGAGVTVEGSGRGGFGSVQAMVTGVLSFCWLLTSVGGGFATSTHSDWTESVQAEVEASPTGGVGRGLPVRAACPLVRPPL